MKLDLSNKGLTTLDGIDLSRVTYLYCSNNQLTSLPPLPKTLKELICWNNQLTSLPPLPETLKKLSCDDNRLLPDLPYGLMDMEKEKLDQHNKKRIDLGLQTVETLPDKRLWDEINEMWLVWQYRIDGAKYNEAVSALH